MSRRVLIPGIAWERILEAAARFELAHKGFLVFPPKSRSFNRGFQALSADFLLVLVVVSPRALAADFQLALVVVFPMALAIIGAACPCHRGIDCKTFKRKIRKSVLAGRRKPSLTLRSKGCCAIKLRSAPELGRWASSSYPLSMPSKLLFLTWRIRQNATLRICRRPPRVSCGKDPWGVVGRRFRTAGFIHSWLRRSRGQCSWYFHQISVFQTPRTPIVSQVS